MSSGNVFERLWKLVASAFQLVLEGKRTPESLADLLQEFVFGQVLPDINWEKVYTELGMSDEYTETMKTLQVGEDSNLWVAPVIMGVTCNKVVATLRRLGVNVDTCGVNDLDAAVPINDRDPNRDGSYIISFARNVEADEKNKNLSANILKNREHKGITLLEYLLLFLGYFLATRRYLDEEMITLCSGSRNSYGYVPSLYWRSDYRKVKVYWYNPVYHHDSLRSRSAVSCQPKPERA